MYIYTWHYPSTQFKTLSRASFKDALTSPHYTLGKTARNLTGKTGQPSHCRNSHRRCLSSLGLSVGLLGRAACLLPLSIATRAGEMDRMVVSLLTLQQLLRKFACFSSRSLFLCFSVWILMLKTAQNIKDSYSKTAGWAPHASGFSPPPRGSRIASSARSIQNIPPLFLPPRHFSIPSFSVSLQIKPLILVLIIDSSVPLSPTLSILYIFIFLLKAASQNWSRGLLPFLLLCIATIAATSGRNQLLNYSVWDR